ncbi:2413_t:CDS:2, partial [Gigaspora margarita]
QKEPNPATSTFRQFSKADKKSNRTKWCLDQASKENWKDYQNLLWSNFKVRIPKELCKEEMSEENSKEKLIIEEEEILRKTARCFQNQYRSKSPKLNQMNEDWRRVYQLIEQIKESWYKDLTEPLSISE